MCNSLDLQYYAVVELEILEQHNEYHFILHETKHQICFTVNTCWCWCFVVVGGPDDVGIDAVVGGGTIVIEEN